MLTATDITFSCVIPSPTGSQEVPASELRHSPRSNVPQYTCCGRCGSAATHCGSLPTSCRSTIHLPFCSPTTASALSIATYSFVMACSLYNAIQCIKHTMHKTPEG